MNIIPLTVRPPKLLLPVESAWETIISAMRGVFATAWDASSRDSFEQLINQGVIKDNVLQNSRSGSVLIFSLFEQLHQNPFFIKHLGQNCGQEYFAKDFCRGMRPALTNFHDLYGQLRQGKENELLSFLHQQNLNNVENTEENINSDKKQLYEAIVKDSNLGIEFQAALEQSEERVEEALEKLLGRNEWKIQADHDSESMAASVLQMTTPEFFHYLYYTDIMNIWSRQQVVAFERALRAAANEAMKLRNQIKEESSTSSNDDEDDEMIFPGQKSSLPLERLYQAGSAKIGQIAILRARAAELDFKTDHQYREFDASDPDFEHKPVAAQVDVLFELTTRYTETFLHDDEEVEKFINTNNQATTAVQQQPRRIEEVEYTDLRVAYFESFLYNKNQKEGALRWRLPLMRAPFEFDMTEGTTEFRRVISSKKVNSNH